MDRQEAIQIMKNNWPTGRNMLSEALEYLIPELIESEDERIRKQILDCFKTMKQQGCFPSKHKEQYNSWITWLEKQKERGPLSKGEEYTLARIIEHLEDNGCPSEWKDLLYDVYALPYQKERKTAAWSEEDEKMFSGLNSIVDDWYNTMSEKEKEYYGDCGYINWLKSLKERMKEE